MNDENFDFEAWEKHMQNIESGVTISKSNPLDINPNITEIKIDNITSPTNLDYLKSLDLKVGTTGIVRFNTRTYGLIRDNSYNFQGLKKGYNYHYIITDINLNNPHIELQLFDAVLDQWCKLDIIGANFIADISNIIIADTKYIDFIEINNDEEKSKKIVDTFNIIVEKNEDLKVENFLKELSINRKNKYIYALKDYQQKIAFLSIDTIFTKCCNIVFDDNWELSRDIASDNFKPNSDYKNRLTLYFPEIEIVNSNNSKHKIVDFYLSLFFDKDFKIFSTMYGRRSKYTVEEFESSYAHSHCYRDRFNWGKMCVGENTPLSNLLYNMASGSTIFNEENLMKLLLLIQGYVGWESLEGTPYVRLETITNKKGSINSYFDRNQQQHVFDQFNKVNHNLLSINNLISFIKNNNYYKFKINEDIFEKEFIFNNISIFSERYTCFKNDNEYFSSNINISDYNSKIERYTRELSDNSNNSRRIFFKNQCITPIVISSFSNNNNSNLCLNPHLLKYLINKLEIDINEYYLKTNKNEFSRIKESA